MDEETRRVLEKDRNRLREELIEARNHPAFGIPMSPERARAERQLQLVKSALADVEAELARP